MLHFARRYYPFMYLRAFVGRQQRRMNIDQLAFPAADKAVGENAHETRQANNLHARASRSAASSLGVERLRGFCPCAESTNVAMPASAWRAVSRLHLRRHCWKSPSTIL